MDKSKNSSFTFVVPRFQRKIVKLKENDRLMSFFFLKLIIKNLKIFD